MNISEIKSAADRGPVYVLLVVGGALIAGIDIPSETVLDQSHTLSASEFITANVVGAVLIIAAAVLSFLVSRALVGAVSRISEASSPAQTVKLIEAIGETAKNVNAQNSSVQIQALDVLEKIRQGVTPTPM